MLHLRKEYPMANNLPVADAAITLLLHMLRLQGRPGLGAIALDRLRRIADRER